MRASLIVNPNAGGTGEATIAQLEAALLELGYDCQHRETQQEEDLERVLQDPGDLVVAAGGDGTLRAVATRLAGRGVPLVPVPMGTANNIGRALNLSGPALEWIGGLRQPRREPYDLGVIRGPWGQDLFLEGAGVGLFAHGMAAYDPQVGKSLLRAIGAAVQTLREFEARAFRVWLDGEPLEEEIMMLQVMNTPSIGPRLRFAPEADPGDGLLDVVLTTADQQVGYLAYLSNLLQDQFTELPNVAHRRCRRVALEWDGSPLHYDDVVQQGQPGRLELEVWPGALEVWLPALAQPETPGGADGRAAESAG